MPTSIRSEASRSVIAVNGADKLAINEDGSMELLTPAADPSGNKIPTASQLPFTKSYTSPKLAFAAGEYITVTHGLGSTPTLYRLSAYCRVAEHGYSVGDVLEVPHFTDVADSTANVRGVALVGDTTSILIQCVGNAVVFPILVKGTGALAAMTPANWRLIVRAWA